MRVANLITLTTDFGLEDSYVGQLKGALIRVHRTVRIIDLCHAIPPHDILSAALTIHNSYRYFPEGSLHLVVVDPGVGSRRHLLVAEADNHLFVAPDNGLLTLFFTDNTISALYRIENASLFSKNISNTFHGRDIMAPVAAELARGMAPDLVGPATTIDSCIHLDLPKPTVSSSEIVGQIIQIDHFGNMRTTITRADLNSFPSATFAELQIKGERITTLAKNYANAHDGRLLALIDSAGYLEIAVNRGNAAQHIDCGIGEEVRVLMQEKK